MLKKYWALLQALLTVIVSFAFAFMLKGILMYFSYVLVVASLLLLLWQIVSLAAEARKKVNTEDSSS